MIRKRLLSACLALALCLGLLPVTAEAAAEGAPSQLYVGNYQITNSDTPTYLKAGSTQGSLEEGSETDWTVKYDPSTATLTLSGATIKGGSDVVSIPYGSGIYAQGSSNQPVTLTIELIGENTITGTFGIYVNAEINASSYGTNATLTIMGDNNGSLEVSGSNNGIYVKSGTGNASLNIKDVAVTSSTNDNYAAGVYVMSSNYATNSPNISLSVDGGSLTASGTGSRDGILFYVGSSQATGATTSLTVSENAIVDARNGGISALKISETLPTPTPTGDNRSGIVFDGSTGTVYGSVTLQEDLTIGEGESLNIPSGASLTIPEDKTLTVDGGTLNKNGTMTGDVIYKVTGVLLSPTTLTLDVGGTATLTATITPSNATDQNVTWSSDPSGIVTITPDTSDSKKATITATGTGTTTIKATVDGESATCSVTVNAAATGPTITTQPQNTTVTEGSPATFIVAADGSNLTYQWQQSTDGGSTWTDISSATSSSYTTQATTAAMSGYQYHCVVTDGNSNSVTSQAATLTVTAATVSVTGVSLDKTELSLTVGDTETLTATVAPANATNQNVTWASSDPSVATVDAAGKVTAVGAGTATITATTVDGGFTAICTVTVRPDIPPANPNYRITVEATQGGTVTADPTAAKAGATVTLTPVPDRGYQVGSVAVTDRFGDAVAVTEQAGGTYTFTMPNGQVTVTVTFAETPLPFTDVMEGDWFYDAVVYAYETGLMDGVEDNLFAPNSQTTRAQLVTILYRLAGEPEPGGDSGFSDVAAGTWYTDAVVWAAENGIVNGTTDATFAPGEDITREQLVTVLYRYAESKGYDVSASADLSGYPDADQIQSYAAESVAWAVAEGLIQGFEDNTLRPAGNATRAQIATILMRFCEGVAK
ncbi:S-layer homology domain-containing protein [Evtepia sp.]|uniref:S-layer homology domain-containing protein n=1 Tax=Evtepia sp. TaxID=2773933 RepID=UPI002E7761D4|nr:S-layer homology domain-containing protein [Evtepia sp.]MEE0749159.1 S-layer homology domain-containing protein [Evtepia sp.]